MRNNIIKIIILIMVFSIILPLALRSYASNLEITNEIIGNSKGDKDSEKVDFQ